MERVDLKRYLTGGLAGFVLGLFFVHPLSMVFQGLVHPISGVELSRVFKAFSVHHLPMAFFFALLGALVGAAIVFHLNVIIRERRKVKVLEGLIPICSYCKKIRDDTGTEKGEGEWHEIEHYIASRSEADFTHGVCWNCYEKYLKEELEECVK